jgi:hypothetical protein
MRRVNFSIPVPELGAIGFLWPAGRTARGSLLAGLAVAAAFALFAAQDGAQSAGTNSIVLADDGLVNHANTSSLVLDAAGRPVIAYRDYEGMGPKILRCGDANCSAGNTFSQPGTGVSGHWASLELNAAGNPVMSYHDVNNGDLRVLRCGNADCTSGNFTAVPDSAGDVGEHNSMELTATGNPVVSYFDTTNLDLKVLRCGDPTCTGGNTIASPDTAGSVGGTNSLVLDALGNPVVSYSGNGDLKVLHCGNSSCTAGNSITSPDTAGDLGSTSIALDAAGNPIVSYRENGAPDTLRVLHCGNPNCTAGNSITVVDSVSGLGNTDLVLDAAGRPVVAYCDSTNNDLKVLHCGNANCTAGNTITSPDTADVIAGFTLSLALDAAGNPVVSYSDDGNDDLKVLHCGTPSCDNNPGAQEIRITSLSNGWPAGPTGAACYDVDPFTADPVFTVCDNNVGPSIATSNACTKDGNPSCPDDDPAIGSIAVAVLAGGYTVTTDSVANHVASTQTQFCNPLGSDAKCTFSHMMRPPWFPWDLNGDGAVAGTDFFSLLQHFGQTQ